MQQAIQSPIDDTLSGTREVAERLGARLKAAIRGRDDVVELVLIALLADGHVLLEDYPGSGKTTLARALGNALAEKDASSSIAAFRRIQFTPDLLPSDITGTNIMDQGQLCLSSSSRAPSRWACAAICRTGGTPPVNAVF